jgi:hypothetical protein
MQGFQNLVESSTLLKAACILFLLAIVLGAGVIAFIELLHGSSPNPLVITVLGGALLAATSILSIHYGNVNALNIFSASSSASPTPAPAPVPPSPAKTHGSSSSSSTTPDVSAYQTAVMPVVGQQQRGSGTA